MKRTFFVPFTLLFFSMPTFAAAEDGIVVTASKLEVPLARSTAAVSVLTASDLERRQTVFTRDAIASLPGVTVSGNGAFGGVTGLRVRGGASEQTVVLIDGVVVNDAASPGGGYNAAFLDTNDVAQVEVLRGPQSTLWGSDAIGGVVNIVTRRPTHGATGAASLEAGSYGTLRAAGSFGYGGERFDVRFGASGFATDGISKADKRDGNSEKDDYDNVTIDGRAGLNVSDALRLEVFGRDSESRTQFDSFGFATGVVDGDEIERSHETTGGGVARLNLFDGRFENQLVASETKIERRYATDNAETFSIEGKRTDVRYQGTVRPNDSLRVAFGAEHERSTLKDTGSTTTDSVFLLADFAPTNTLNVTGGVRYDDHSKFGDVTTGQVGLRWQALENAGVRASWGQGFKAPTVFQLSFFFPPATGPNLALKPEKAEGWDAAIFATGFDKRLSAEVGYFDLDTENLISFANGRYFNVARARSKGVEAQVDWRASDAVRVSGNYTWTDAENAVTGKRLIQIPENAAFAEIDWTATPALSLTATARYTGEKKDTVRPANRAGVIESWARLDLSGRYRIGAHAELFARVENVTDEHYQEIFGYGTPGRSVYGGVKVRFE